MGRSKITSLGVLLLFLAAQVTAQQNDFLSRSELLLSGGGMTYIGDLNNQSVLGTVHSAFGGGLRCRLDNRWAARAEVAFGTISGGEPDYIALRNLHFQSKIFETTVLAEFNFWSFETGVGSRRWTFFLFGGIGVFHFNPMTHYIAADGVEQWVELQPLGTEGQGTGEYSKRSPYVLTQLCLPFGVGIKYRFSKAFSLSAEYGFRKTWTDYLDDVSTTYVGAALLCSRGGNGELAARLADRSGEVSEGYVNAAGIKRGDDSLDDWYTCFRIAIGVEMESLFGWLRSKRCKL